MNLRKLKSAGALLLATVILLSTLPVDVLAAATYSGVNPFWMPMSAQNEAAEWNVYRKSQGLGEEVTPTIKVNGRTLRFNRELWDSKSVVVYGDYSLVGGNDFKVLAGGFYRKDGKAGEYRYHGYDISGNSHHNREFPPDANHTAKVEDKRWIYRPWKETSPHNDFFKRRIGPTASLYNEAALGERKEVSPSEQNTVAKWINSGQDWGIQHTFQSGVADKSFMNYMNVATAPTTNTSGQGAMMHVLNGSPWYQTFSIKKIATKLITPVTADIQYSNTYDDKGNVILTVRVTGALQDSDYYKDEIKKTAYYTRYDLSYWNFELKDSITNQPLTKKGGKTAPNTGAADFTITIPKAEYEKRLDANKECPVPLTGKATAVFYNELTSSGVANKTAKIKASAAPLMPMVTEPEEEPEKTINFDVDAPLEILDAWKFPVRLIIVDDSAAVDRYVTLDGRQLSEAEETRFLNGEWKFPEIREDRVYDYEITYVHEDGSLWYYNAFVIVYDSVPRAAVRLDDPGKVNRKVTATADPTITSKFLRANSSVKVTSFTVTSPDGQEIFKGTDTAAMQEFLVKQPGVVDVTVEVGNEYGSRSYTHQTYQGEDYAPDIVSIVWSAVMSRLDTLDMMAEGASVDGDTAGQLTYEIKYDSDRDGVTDLVVASGVWSETVQFKPDKLGWYDITLKVTESFGQPTIEKHITPEDYKTTTLVREFCVDNLAPMTKLFTDIEFNFPVLDVMLLTDEKVTREQNDYLRDNRVGITNDFRVSSMVATVDHWDLKTYEFSQQGYQRMHTGSTYPADTIAYAADGYSGTLTRYKLDNYSYDVDEGQWKTRTRTKTVTMQKVAWGEDGVEEDLNPDGSGTVTTYYWAEYEYDGPDGYCSGSGTGYMRITYGPGGKKISSTSTNKPTMQGKITIEEEYWESKWVTYNDYYGDYSGTIYKHVKQNYSPNLATESAKYIVYFAGSELVNTSDFSTLHNIARDAKIILVADPTMKGKLGENTFIENTGDTAAIMKQIVALAKAANPVLNERAILVGQTFTLNSADIDAEGDPISEIGYQYVHDPNHFDNPMGREANTYPAYGATQYKTGDIRSSFGKPGKYTIYRQTKDTPELYPEMGVDSNEASLDIVVHRKPIASATLDWDFDATAGTYKTRWVDHSYDPDYQFSDPDKGIINRKIRYRLTTSIDWIYEIPDNLAPGSYTLEYVVEDKHGVWSDPFAINFTLSNAPSIQFNASMRALKTKFSLAALPASEAVEFFGIWTRYPYNVKLEAALYNSTGSSRIGAVKTVNFTQGTTGSKSGNDIAWNNIPYDIPAATVDGSYTMRIMAIDVANAAIAQSIDFPIQVYTPINLASPFTELQGSESNVITATTSIYPSTVTVELFRGTAKATTLNMAVISNDGQTKTWQATYTAPGSATLPEGSYAARFTATNPSGKFETLDKNVELQHLRVTSMEIVGDWTYWHGQVNLLGKQMANMPHRFMGYEAVHVNAVIVGNPDRVEVRFSPALEAMIYTNSLGHTYRYADEMKKTVTFPLAMTSRNGQNFTVKYTLPLANQTMDYNDQRLRSQYWVEVTAYKGAISHSMKITDIDYTGTIHDRIYTQPE